LAVRFSPGSAATMLPPCASASKMTA
jgi:hypothetical protein